MNEVLVFIIALLIPILFFRTLFYASNKFLTKTILREKTGLKIHHMHYGTIMITIASILLLFLGKTIYIIALLGLGLGYVLDEFIASVMLKTNRKEKLKIYDKAFKPTVILFVIVIGVIVLLYLI
jgi:hypothetical protein